MIMAWYNILDNASSASSARKECKKIEVTSGNLVKKNESITASIKNKITCSETLFDNSFKAFQNALSEAHDSVTKISKFAQKYEIKSFEKINSLAVSSLNTKKAGSDGVDVSSLLLASSGGITAAGAYTAVGIVGTASTGTAIGTLSGAAASNATLAWFGGGAVASGGGGILAGTAVLGAIVAAPILFTAADQASKYYEKKRNNLKQYLEELTLEHASLESQKMHIDSIATRVKKKVQLLDFISERLHQNTSLLNNITTEKGLSDLETAISMCCIQNIHHLRDKAESALSFPIVSDKDMEDVEPLNIDIDDIEIKFSKKNWKI